MWSKHGINDSLEVRESEHYGRGVYARAAISPGVEVMRAEPFVHVISDDVRGQLCDHCLKESETLLRCGHCKFVRYCSKDCQRGDWRCHGGECKGIARAVPHSPTPLMRMVARALQRTREKQSTHKQEMDLFCSNVEKLSQEVKEELATLMFGVRLLLEEPDSHTMEKAYSILCKALCNTFTIHRADLDAIGAGLYLGPSLLNHSCLPNCVAVFSGPTLMIRAIRPIPAGEQLLISYLDLLDGLEQRRRTLRRTYSFQCECERCQTECAPQDSQFRTMYTAVGTSSEREVSEAIKAGMDSLQKIQAHRKRREWSDVVAECELSLCRQASVLQPSHHVTLNTLQQLIYACIEAGDWSKAITASRKLTEPLQQYLPRFHPVYAIHLLRQGKLHRLSGTTEHLKHSITDLSQAVDQLKVVYGPAHPSTCEALELLQTSQIELGHRQHTKTHNPLTALR